MRFLIIFAIVSSIICLSNGQRPTNSFQDSSINPFVNPSFSSSSSQLSPNHSVGGTLSRIFGWFGRTKKQNNQLDSSIDSKSSSEGIDFSSSLPKESTDRIISDAIADRILEESKEHQTVVGSPFIQDNSSVVVVNGRESYGKSVANEPNDKIPITEALRIVSTSNLSDCVARVICELSCNANAYGPAGRVVFKNIIKLQFDQTIKNEDAKYFRQAASKGRQIVQSKRDCKECYTLYPSCKSNSNDLVAVSSMFKL